ncbi:hypothetical protein V8F20_008161 [Naviculisporaceae sp. PSN 640]
MESNHEPHFTENTTEQSTESYKDAAKRYALSLCDRVESFDTSPLHSASYLTYLAKYLKTSFQKPRRRPHNFESPSTDSPKPFIIQYLLQQDESPKIQPFHEPHKWASLPLPSQQNELLFFTGRPSADWLNYVGSRYSLDHRFFHQHLGPVISGSGQWTSGDGSPDLPSRSLQVLSLRIPTVITVGSRGRNLDIRDLEIAREKCNAQLRRACQAIQDGAAAEAGRSIIRRLEVFDGSTMVMEQQLTGTIVHRANGVWTVILWSDAGHETDHGYIPIPSTKDFALVASELKFCPVFFENEFVPTKKSSTAHGEESQSTTSYSKQPLSLLSRHYGVTLDWSTPSITASPLYVLSELFTFQAASILQLLNTVERVLTEMLERCDFPSYEHTKLEMTVQYDYIRASLSRLEQHCSDIISFLQSPPTKWNSPTVPGATRPDTTLLITDFNYLLTRNRNLLKACESGKSTLITNDAIQKAKRSAKEAELVTQLTKTTTRLGYIFLPISFVTSAFGMNFAEFGQGPLPIWIWAVIVIPMLVLCVVFVECADWIWDKWRRLRKDKVKRKNDEGLVLEEIGAK